MIDRRNLLIGGAALAAMPAASHAALPVPPGNRLGFDIMRGTKKLGTHVLTFEQAGDLLTVRVAVDLIFKIAGITLYRYHHQATERWQGDRVIALETQTDDNGTPLALSAHRESAGLVVQGPKGLHYVAPADALPATHWNHRELDGPWINTQDGKIMRPRVTPQGTETIPTAGGGSIRARRYALSGDVQIDMFYDERLGWAGLSFTKGGALVRYQRQG